MCGDAAIAKTRRATVRTAFLHWYAVAGTSYLLVLCPFLVLPRDLAPIADQLTAHALIVAAAAAGTGLWALALTALGRAISFVAGSPGAEARVERSGASFAAAFLGYLLLASVRAALRGGAPEPVILDLLFADGCMATALAALVALFHIGPVTRFREHFEGIFARVRLLGALFACCSIPFLLLVAAQAARIAFRPATSAAPVSTPAPSNVVIVLLDALPMGKTSLAPGADDLTPSLARFAGRSFVFRRAYSPSNVTSPSVATLLTGKQPVNHGVAEVKMSLRGRSRRETLPAELGKAGVVSGAMVANFEAHPRQLKLEGFDRVFPMRGRGFIPRAAQAVLSFADFNLGNLWSFSMEGWFVVRCPDTGHAHPWPPERNFADALEFLSGGGRPRFAFVHVMPPHAPYLADPPFLYSRLPARGFMDTPSSREIGLYRPYPESERERIGMLEKRYEETVLSVDRRLGRFLDSLEASGRFEDSIIVVLSDHGEMFAPRWVAHLGPYLDDALVHVPLLIHLPGQTTGRSVDEPIGLVDVAPTILDLEGLPVPAWMDGASWKPVFSGGAAPDRPAFSLTSEAILSLVKGEANGGACRMSRGSFGALLDLAGRKAVLAGPEGRTIVSFDAPGEAGGAAGFDEAVRAFCPGKSAR